MSILCYCCKQEPAISLMSYIGIPDTWHDSGDYCLYKQARDELLPGLLRLPSIDSEAGAKWAKLFPVTCYDCWATKEPPVSIGLLELAVWRAKYHDV